MHPIWCKIQTLRLCAVFCFNSDLVLFDIAYIFISSGVWPIWPQRSALYTGCPWTTAVNCINSCTTKSARRSMLLHVHEPGGAYKDIGSFMSWLSFIESNWTIKKVLSRRLLHPPSNPSNPPRHRRTRSQERTIKDIVAPTPTPQPQNPATFHGTLKKMLFHVKTSTLD